MQGLLHGPNPSATGSTGHSLTTTKMNEAPMNGEPFLELTVSRASFGVRLGDGDPLQS